jgi:hypothetical protein
VKENYRPKLGEAIMIGNTPASRPARIPTWASSEAYRDLLLRRLSKLEEALRVQKWLASPELQAPK